MTGAPLRQRVHQPVMRGGSPCSMKNGCPCSSNEFPADGGAGCIGDTGCGFCGTKRHRMVLGGSALPASRLIMVFFGVVHKLFSCKLFSMFHFNICLFVHKLPERGRLSVSNGGSISPPLSCGASNTRTSNLGGEAGRGDGHSHVRQALASRTP